MHRGSIRHFLLRYVLPAMLAVLPLMQIRADSKKAFKLLAKGEYAKLRVQLDKSIRKDSINAGSRYVYSLLFNKPEHPGYHLDSAYLYILGAFSDYDLEDAKEKSRLAKIGIDSGAMETQKASVEARAFERSRRLHTIGFYNHFIQNYPTAVEVDSAIRLRDAIAFEQAASADTYEAYADFMETYPEAVQVPEARRRYDILLFRERTRSGGLASQEQFVRDFPDSPYRAEAERNIFEIMTAGNRPDDYLNFLRRHRGSSQQGRATGRLYHRLKEELPPSEALRFAPELAAVDSLGKVAMAEEGYLVPIYDLGLYGFMDAAGRQTIAYSYSGISPDYRCGRITADILMAVLDDKPVLINRLGQEVCENPWDETGELGSGLLQVWQNNRAGVVFKTGEKVMDIRYEGIELIGRAFIKAGERGKWGLYTVCGRELLPPEYDDIYAEGNFIFIETSDLLAVQSIESLSLVPDRGPTSLSFRYDDYELMGSGYLLLFRDDMESLVDSMLEERVALGRHHIDPLHGGWAIRDSDGVLLLDGRFQPKSAMRYEQLLRVKGKAALRQNGKWAFYRAGTEPPLVFSYDSAAFLSDDIALLRDGPNTYALFANDSLVNISGASQIRLLRAAGGADSLQYLLGINPRGTSTLYSHRGQRLLSGRFDEVEAHGQEYITVEVRGKKGLYHRSGQELLKARYDAIGNYENGYLSTLLQGKFGIFHYGNKINLAPKYQRAIRPYGSEYFLGYKGNQMAFIGRDNHEISGWIFDEVEYWTDSAALVKGEKGWGIYRIHDRQWLVEGIGSFRYLRNDPDEKVLRIIVGGKAGLLSNRSGLVITPTLDDLINLGTGQQPIYYGERYIPEAEFYVVIYYDGKGETLRRQVFDRDEYQRIACD